MLIDSIKYILGAISIIGIVWIILWSSEIDLSSIFEIKRADFKPVFWIVTFVGITYMICKFFFPEFTADLMWSICLLRPSYGCASPH